jgi:hypothetical protein
VNAVTTAGNRLSLVCEQYSLNEDELEEIPHFTLESRVNQGNGKKQKK